MSFFPDDFFLPLDRHLRVIHVDEVTIKRVSRPPNGHVHWPNGISLFISFCVFIQFLFFLSFVSLFFLPFCLFRLAIHHHVVGSLTVGRHTFIHFSSLCSMFSLDSHFITKKSVVIRTQKRSNHLKLQHNFQSYLTHT
jgi:hypothetical protein